MQYLFSLGAWHLQKDTIDHKPIASIRHMCQGMRDVGCTIWFNKRSSITICYCGALVPEEIQALCVLFNMEWVQETELNG